MLSWLQYLGVVQNVEGLQAVGEGHPDKVSECQHEAEALGGDVHGGQDGGLKPQCICNIPASFHQSGVKGWCIMDPAASGTEQAALLSKAHCEQITIRESVSKLTDPATPSEKAGLCRAHDSLQGAQDLQQQSRMPRRSLIWTTPNDRGDAYQSRGCCDWHDLLKLTEITAATDHQAAGSHWHGCQYVGAMR